VYRIDPKRLDLVEEFKARPFGPHGHELTRLLNALRLGSNEGRYVLVCTRRHRQWALGQLTGRRGEPVRLLEDRRFDNLAEAEWTVFKLRWRARTGENLDRLVEPPRYDPSASPGRR